MTRLGQLARLNPRTNVSVSWPTALIAMADVDAATATALPRLAHGPEDAGSATKVVLPGDVLFARISPSMENGKVAIVPSLQTGIAVVSGEFHVLRPNPGVDPRWIWAFLRRNSVRRRLQKGMTGSAGQQRVQPRAVEALELPATPDRAGGLDAVEHLDRAAVLRRAAEALCEELPAAAAWHWSGAQPRRQLRAFGVDMAYGTSERAAQIGGLPVLRIPNVVEGYIDDRELRFFDEGWTGNAVLDDRDLLVVRTNGNPERLGRAAVYEGHPKRALFASYLIRMRGGELDPDFLWAWLRTTEARQSLLARARTSAGQFNLNKRTLGGLLIPNVSPSEQRQIASVARTARATSDRARRQLATLEQTVQAVLEQLFKAASSRVVPVEAETVRLPIAHSIASAASPTQLRVWDLVRQQTGSFSTRDLVRAEEAVEAGQALGVLEHLGLLVRDDLGAIDRWLAPEPVRIGPDRDDEPA